MSFNSFFILNKYSSIAFPNNSKSFKCSFTILSILSSLLFILVSSAVLSPSIIVFFSFPSLFSIVFLILLNILPTPFLFLLFSL
uniref:Uncharacterized protein n=1 Tax=Methanococcus maripaludis (strain C5 / ATCC BAA-1333) TaxID=402880 RepID=O06105_METM5|nr:unknown [Methanococcus maripaludis C5]